MNTKPTMTNPKFIELALEVGGSHYPEVGGAMLEHFAELLVRECANLARKQNVEAEQSILSHYNLQ